MGKYASQLTILSKLRNLESETIKNIKAMPQLFDITTSILYQEGMEKGMEKGREEMMKKNIILIANLLDIPKMSLEQIVTVAGVELNSVHLVKEKLDSGEWTHPLEWKEEQWSVYFDEREY